MFITKKCLSFTSLYVFFYHFQLAVPFNGNMYQKINYILLSSKKEHKAYVMCIFYSELCILRYSNVMCVSL